MERSQLAERILQHVGGEKNVVSLIHCMTRLRFTLRDSGKVNERELRVLPGVLGSTDNGGQYQVIIGNDVPKVYQEVVKLLPAQGASQASGGADEPKKKMNVLMRMVNVLSSAMAPIVPALAGAGILKVIISLLVLTGVLTAEDRVYYFLSFFADAVFYFLPFMLALSSANKFKVNPYLALAIAGIMLHPKWIELVTANEPVALLGVPVTLINYSSTVIPIIVVVWLMSYVERFAERVSPGVIKVFFKPLVVIIVMAPVALLAVGPLGYHLGNGLAVGIYFIQEKVGWLALAILSGFKPLLVMTGMHWAFTPAIITSIATYGYDGLMAVSSLSAIFSLTGACFAVAIKTRDKSMRQIAISSGTTALLSGVTEPAIYGVVFRLKRPMIASIIAGLIAGVFAGIVKLKIFAMVSPSLLKLPSFVSDLYPGNFLNAVITASIALVASFILTFVLGFKDESVSEVQPSGAEVTGENGSNAPGADAGPAALSVLSKQQLPVFSPLRGEAVDLSKVDDNVFADELMGKGIAVIPAEGRLVSPVGGTVTTLTKSKHAISVTSDEGVEVLMHIGVDTVRLKGQFFENLVEAGDRVEVGDPLIEFSIEDIRAAGFDVITPIIITNTADYLDVIGGGNRDVQPGDQLIAVLQPHSNILNRAGGDLR
ncbi:beta-glucoside-specific PTS transporter subunit IIABC [Saccharibacillus sp. CPCC 101409]|uniref:beta-glucoside-specific PTS transporter subunit IIABC n=1 Tax=Saccharibacillus sp. CPCC 101409 TaxID=3058041 RepID=UPI002672070A|nr:beta-glucoside-specific PTS transporter subunit IIABC [Saccharibacillus sp. CPCC 101409]MDO3409443.1 beta-glucoside-specific PTS transporter subunit IIABC [Saccharibacillus sp. CPCC 101409]